jgi:hypothetical protein
MEKRGSRNGALLATGIRSKNHLMRPIAFGEPLSAGTRLTLFSDDKPDRFFTVIKFWMDEAMGFPCNRDRRSLPIRSKTRKAEFIY